MKGDERVELGEESADSCLLLDFSRQSQFGFEEVARRNVKQPMILPAFKVRIRADNLLRRFVLEGGFDL